VGIVDIQGLRGLIPRSKRSPMDVYVVKIVSQERCMGDILLGANPVLTRIRVVHVYGLTEIGEIDPIALQHDIILGIATTEGNLFRGGTNHVLDEVRGELGNLSLFINDGSMSSEYFKGFFILDKQSRFLENFKGGQMDFVKFIFGKNIDAEPPAHSLTSMQVSFQGNHLLV
jgi:hypothetical protein